MDAKPKNKAKKHKKKKNLEDNPSGEKHEEQKANSVEQVEHKQEKVANISDVANNKKKKKKDKKRKEIDTQNLDDHEVNNDDSTALPRKRALADSTEEYKKKKKKKTSIEDSESTSHEETLANAETPVDDCDDTTDPKKKRKKKKKKKKMSEEAPAGGKKSIRRMKWEKHCQRQADEKASAKDQLKTQTLSYLSQWKHDRANWKFMKARQVWLYKTKFSPTYIPEASWPILLEYFESTQGNIRKMLLDDANKVIAKMDEWSEKNAGANPKDSDDEGADGETPEEDKPDVVTYKRARDLIQCLQE